MTSHSVERATDGPPADGPPGVAHIGAWRRAVRIGRRFAIPRLAMRLAYFLKFRCFVAPHAEVEFSPQARWGPACAISSFAKIKINGPFTMGRQVQIGSGCFIEVSSGGLHIGDDVMIGSNSSILTSSYVYDRVGIPLQQQGIMSRGVRIGRNVWIGVNTVILDGTTIGEDVIVSAGSVVSGVIPDRSIVQGDPGRVVFTRR